MANSGAAEIATRLNCEVFVQFEDFDSFFKAVQTLVGKALVKVKFFILFCFPKDFKNTRGITNLKKILVDICFFPQTIFTYLWFFIISLNFLNPFNFYKLTI